MRDPRREKDDHEHQALFPVTEVSGLTQGELGQDFVQGQSEGLALKDPGTLCLLSSWGQVGRMGVLCMCLWKETFLLLRDFPKKPK